MVIETDYLIEAFLTGNDRERESKAAAGRVGAASLHRMTTPEQRLVWQKKGAEAQRQKWEEWRRERDANRVLESKPKRKYTKRVSRGSEGSTTG